MLKVIYLTNGNPNRIGAKRGRRRLRRQMALGKEKGRKGKRAGGTQAVKAVTIAQRQMPKNDAAARQKRKKKQHRLLYHLCRLLGQGIWDIGLIFYYQFDISQS
jgi:hypothetical protein